MWTTISPPGSLGSTGRGCLEVEGGQRKQRTRPPTKKVQRRSMRSFTPTSSPVASWSSSCSSFTSSRRVRILVKGVLGTARTADGHAGRYGRAVRDEAKAAARRAGLPGGCLPGRRRKGTVRCRLAQPSSLRWMHSLLPAFLVHPRQRSCGTRGTRSTPRSCSSACAPRWACRQTKRCQGLPGVQPQAGGRQGELRRHAVRRRSRPQPVCPPCVPPACAPPTCLHATPPCAHASPPVPLPSRFILWTCMMQ